MDKKQEILKKYSMFLNVKIMVILFGIIAALTLCGYYIVGKINGNIAPIFMIMSIISLTLFLILWISMRPMKKHILSVINEYQK